MLLPLLIFSLAALVAFSIGTSWTTMAILIPTVVPLAHALGGLPLTVLAAAALYPGWIGLGLGLLAIPVILLVVGGNPDRP